MYSKNCEINWIVIPAPKLEQSRFFYSEVFGWEISEYSKNYLIFKTGNISGGLDKNLEVVQGGICFSITVNEIYETLKIIEEHGGKIHKEKTEIGKDFGFFGSFYDPNGNIIELWSKK